MKIPISREYIEIRPISDKDEKWRFDKTAAMKAAAVVGSLFLGPKGIPSALSNLPDAIKMLSKSTNAQKSYESQGFLLYISAMTMAISQSLNEAAPLFSVDDDTRTSLTEIIVASLRTEPVYLSRRFFRTPALNPAFVRVREAISSALNFVDRSLISEDQIEKTLTVLGRNFSHALFDLTKLPETKHAFADFLALYESLPVDEAVGRGWIWDDYRAHLNQQLYRRLFLHELQEHPNITLPDVYVSSRGIYRAPVEDESTSGEHSPAKRLVHAFDMADFLKNDWLMTELAKAGSTRLVTGDPGTGKSTFSLHFAQHLSDAGWRVLYIPANSIRSLDLSLTSILTKHLQFTLKLDSPPNVEAELNDPENTGKPLLIIIDGLDEYDVGGATVSLAAARLVDHAVTVVDEWNRHGYDVRLLLCGRPESATSLTSQFRDPFQHLHVTGFVYDRGQHEQPANQMSDALLSIDQREEWWSKWQLSCGEPVTGLPVAIRDSAEYGVVEITAQPLLNYMLAVLKLYEPAHMSNLSALYGSLFDKYYLRQREGKSVIFAKLCPDVERFRRIMSEIGIAAWHAGDRSVGTEDLRQRFDRPPLKNWFETAGRSNKGLSAILSAFYTRPEDAALPDSGLAQRYVFTHKSFREYLTAVGVVRFVRLLTTQTDSDAEEGWSDRSALARWLELFGPTALDGRQWEFIKTELAARVPTDELSRVQKSMTHLLNLSLRRQMPISESASSFSEALTQNGNAEEALICMLSATRQVLEDKKSDVFDFETESLAISVSWPRSASDQAEDPREYSPFALTELMHRLKARPGSPDQMLLQHVGCLFEKGSVELSRQVSTEIRSRPDAHGYAKAFDFSGMRLTGSALANSDLAFARFHRAQLEKCDLSSSILRSADLSHSFVTNCRIKRSFISGANFVSAVLEKVDLASTYPHDPSLHSVRHSEMWSLNEASLDEFTQRSLRKLREKLGRRSVKGSSSRST